ncbi:MAG: Arm DNA-binding domain-containing protein, partial [Casimicrobium sp.]
MAKPDVKFRNAKPTEKPYKLGDSLGLYLLVNPSGSKYWRFKYRLDGKEKLLALGVYPDVSLEVARAGRDKARTLVAEGIDPVATLHDEKRTREAETVNTFELVAREWWAHWKGGRTERHAGYVLRRM